MTVFVEMVGQIGIVAMLAYGLAWLLIHPRNPWRALDVPNTRSLHASVVPRGGGLAILGATAVGLSRFAGTLSMSTVLILAALLAVTTTSGIDDQKSLPVSVRLGVQLAAAALVVGGGAVSWPSLVAPGVVLDMGWAGALIAVAFLVWYMNLYNFMDGMDGFAGGMTVVGFGALALLAWGHHDDAYALVAATISAAGLGFTVTNFPPARLFMGDVGSVPLGFLAGVMTLVGVRHGDFPLWAAGLVFSPFSVDATVTLVTRIIAGENPARAHRRHYYQRLVMRGWGHRRTVLAEYGLMLACGLSAGYGVRAPILGQWVIIAAWTAIYGILVLLIGRQERNER
ncbi:MAG: MraY family glycosyltransferase [Acidiferrobacter sp.]